MAHIAHNPDAWPDMRTALDLGAVLPRTAELRDGHLWIGGVDTVALAAQFGTALYVMDEAHIRGQLREYLTQLREHYPTADVAYAGKAFCCQAMCRLVAEEGGWLDVSSGGELACAQAAGFPVERVVVHGNCKTPLELWAAIEAGAGLIVADCFEELERIDRVAGELGVIQPILLRLTPGIIADTHEYMQTGAEDSKFGFGIGAGAALAAVEKALQAPGIALKGYHIHIGSQIFAFESYQRAIEVLLDFAAGVRDATGFTPEVLDLGGGVGVAYQADDQPGSIAAFASTVTAALCQQLAAHDLPEPRLLVEPGRSIVANAGVTLYTVGVLKDLPGIRTWVAVDGGMSDNIRTALYDAHYECLLANKADQPRSTVVTVAGKHCESGDVVAIDASLQPAEPFDILAVCTTGAYNYSMASNYNRQVRPGVVWVQDGQAREVLRRETYEDLLRCEV
ncbi:MAG: diaminopimelate decarboxylase [Coriobacteriales bacterium]|jgi:diaminopimelate decarboxylase|nr:diaminopimelate decarboxylase [Coriobacteriales bacterium]